MSAPKVIKHLFKGHDCSVTDSMGCGVQGRGAAGAGAGGVAITEDEERRHEVNHCSVLIKRGLLQGSLGASSE